MVPEKVVHYPFSLALHGSTLLVGSTAADGKYNAGRLIGLNTGTIKAAIDNRDFDALKNWNKIVTNNVMIPPSVGPISFSERLILFTSRGENKLLSLPVKHDALACNKPMSYVESCEGVKSIHLSESDPYSFAEIQQSAKENTIALSYLTSSRLDILKINQQGITLRKHFDMADWLRSKKALHELRRVITKKVFVTHKHDPANATVYFLLEHHLKDFPFFTKPRLSHVLSVKVSDLLADEPLHESKIDLIELTERFNLIGVQDLYVDEVQNEAIVLGRMPEALYKIDLGKKSLVKTSVVCTESTTMAVNNNLDLIVVPCFKDNRVQAYSLSQLELTRSSTVIGRGPAFAAIDEKNKLVYCSLNLDGTVVVLDLMLNQLAEIFDKAPSSRTGS